MEAQPLPAGLLSAGNRAGGAELVKRVAAEAEVGAGAIEVEPGGPRVPFLALVQQLRYPLGDRLDQLARNR